MQKNKKQILSTTNWTPIKEIKPKTIILKNEQILKILEIIPINFKLKTYEEQRSILYQYHSFLKTINTNIQISIQIRPTNISNYKEKYKEIQSKQKDEKIKEMLSDYIELINEFLIDKQTISRRFFIIFIAKDQTEIDKTEIQIKEGLMKCGNQVIEIENQEYIKIFYEYLNKEFNFLENI